MFEGLFKLAEKVETFKSEMLKKQSSGVFSNDFLKELAEQTIKDIKSERDAFYRTRQEELKGKMEAIIKKHQKPLTDEEVNRELLRLKKLEAEVKFMTPEELQKIAHHYIDNGEGDHDTLNLVGAQLKALGERDKEAGKSPVNYQLAIQLKAALIDRNIKEPWLNDKEYRALEKEAKALSVVSSSNHDDYIYPGLGTDEGITIELPKEFAKHGVQMPDMSLEAKISRKNELFELIR
jgi:hypothetical protein